MTRHMPQLGRHNIFRLRFKLYHVTVITWTGEYSIEKCLYMGRHGDLNK